MTREGKFDHLFGSTCFSLFFIEFVAANKIGCPFFSSITLINKADIKRKRHQSHITLFKT